MACVELLKAYAVAAAHTLNTLNNGRQSGVREMLRSFCNDVFVPWAPVLLQGAVAAVDGMPLSLRIAMLDLHHALMVAILSLCPDAAPTVSMR